jgi:ABC-type amino acid transport substrate-binding protein
VEATIWERQIRDLTIEPYPSVDEALGALSHGDVDAALVDHIGALLYLGQNRNLVFAPDPITEEPFALVVLEEQQVLLEVLNKSLSKLRNDNQLQMILDRWLSN